MPRYNPNTGQLETYQVGPFDSPHLYLQWGGKLLGGEIWSCGLRMASTDGSFTSLDPAGMLAGVTTAVQNLHTNAAANISPNAKLSFVKLNAIGEDGKYIEDHTYESIVADVAGGGSGAVAHILNQNALAVSLLTDVTRGPAHRGRFYLPMPVLTVDVNGRIATSARDAVRGVTNTFLAALNAVDAGYKVAVFSRKAGLPAHRLVTTTAIGLVIDTQRRRRNKLAEMWA
jgi:hypothetical protein